MPIQDSDLLLIEDTSGASKSIEASKLMTGLKAGTYDGYKLLVNKADYSSAYVLAEEMTDKVDDTHFMLVERGGVSYKAVGTDIQDYFGSSALGIIVIQGPSPPTTGQKDLVGFQATTPDKDPALDSSLLTYQWATVGSGAVIQTGTDTQKILKVQWNDVGAAGVSVIVSPPDSADGEASKDVNVTPNHPFGGKFTNNMGLAASPRYVEWTMPQFQLTNGSGIITFTMQPSGTYGTCKYAWSLEDNAHQYVNYIGQPNDMQSIKVNASINHNNYDFTMVCTVINTNSEGISGKEIFKQPWYINREL